ncbi:major paralogous domain-containing protein [Aquiflexum balticum DSM 16537]|uniref:Major paralogous domain-containing protein n=1 Tax=Aquiflexum balticum DSM 16537 TaxID=758820 RepID=A0A1W2H6J7_9BACT|nr:FISUMP domain-containing protein [Aquiflexum balticum]SMD44479.1 major paralogous domain-containing protein [Aquiflexum balticum DSM 16537]
MEYQNGYISTKIKSILFFVLLFLIFGGQLSAQETITDIDGNVYETVLIGNQRWITSNLRVKTYRNGDPIPQIQDPIAWSNARFGAWCYFNNDPATEEEYGVLYNAYSFLDPRGLAPEGSYVTSMCDWAELYITLEGRNIDYYDNKMADKIKVPEFFNNDNQPNPIFHSNPTNSSGLSIRSGGWRTGTIETNDKGFFYEGIIYGGGTYHWTTTQDGEKNGLPLFRYAEVYRQSPRWDGLSKTVADWGKPIRVIVGVEAEKFTYVTQEQAFCGSNQVSQLQFSVQKPNSFGCTDWLEPNCYIQYKWYKDIDLTLLADPNEVMKDGDIYYGKAVHVAFNSNFDLAPPCKEEILEVTVRVLEPKKPTGPENQVRCAGGTIEDLTAVGDEIRWYPSLTSTTALAPGTVLQNNRLYYAENRIGSCVHPERLRVQVELVSPSAPVAANNQEICEGRLLADLEVDGENLIWFSESGDILPVETAVGDGILYFVASVVGDCESPRTAIRVVLGGPTAPLGEENQNFCPGTLISDMVVSGEDIRWYGSPTGMDQLSLNIPLENGKTYYASQKVDGCEGSNRKAVRVFLLDVPLVSAVTQQEFCNAATLAGLQATGTNIRWYSDQNLTKLLTLDNPLENKTYYATQTLNGCEGAALAVQVTINTVTMPQGDMEQGFCTGALVSDLIATGTDIRWYANPTGGTLLANNLLLQNGNTYYAEQTVDGCTSASRLAVRISVSSTDLPTASANQTLCTGAVVSEIEIEGENIRWYASTTGDALLTNSELLVSGKTYYATQTIGGCESASRRAVQVRVVNVPNFTAPQNQAFCNTATVSNLQATGSNISWYADQNLTTFLSPTSPLENGRTYYATQTQEGCQSTAVAVKVSIIVVAPPSGNSEQEFCNSAFVSELNATGTSIQWFSTASGGNPLAGNLPLQDGASYYAEQTVDSCPSATRLAVRVRINTPQLPGGPSQQEFCEGALVSELQASGTNLIWYRNATGQETMNPNDPIQDGGSYFVSQRIGDCESARKEIRASIISVQPAIVEGEQQFCESDSPTVANLFAVGESIRWYSSATGGQPLSENERLMDGQTYYAVNVSARGCESSTRATVRVIVQPCEVEVFNMVTRDGNNKNEYLKISNIESFPDNRLEIYNRYGVLVWAADGYGQNGKFFNGESNQLDISQPELGLPTGNYLYALTYKKPGSTLPIRETGYLYLLNSQRK